ncbi:uncharacterized protein LOC101847210 isoform X2 [Aplysia californica]|uniref:Uncharacterized protein LOC101847210 isoform X2 n=1 Tax=Aplysia californica TaxID=6500 RepID=A0ABM1A847_APLCA|nr:uncharacterized protein LOC101847210 isoform X2 [Aplysia californica]
MWFWSSNSAISGYLQTGYWCRRKCFSCGKSPSSLEQHNVQGCRLQLSTQFYRVWNSGSGQCCFCRPLAGFEQLLKRHGNRKQWWTTGTCLIFFYAETDRMLKPGGVMAVFCGGFPSYEDQEVLSIYKKILATTGETHPEQMKVANDNMESFRLPYPNSKRFLPINRHLEATAEQSIQMSLTIHSFQDYVQKHPEYMEEVRQMFREWNKGDESKTYKFAVPTYLLTSQKPTQ